MGKYEGINCPICNKPLENGENIVICDQCGAPYHRGCISGDQRCIYTDLHRLGESWEPPVKEPEKFAGNEDKRCSRCGTINPINGLFCEVCGNTLNTSQAQTENFSQQHPNMGQPQRPINPMPYDPFTTPFGGVNPDEKIDDVDVKDIAIFVAQNTQYYIPKFKQYQENASTSTFNFSAFLFTWIFFLYRKMYLWGAVLFAVSFIISIPSAIIQFNILQETLNLQMGTFVVSDTLQILSNVFGVVNFALMLLSGVFANKLYKHHCISKIKKVKEQFTEHNEYNQQLLKNGSISKVLILILVGGYVLMAILSSFMLFLSM